MASDVYLAVEQDLNEALDLLATADLAILNEDHVTGPEVSTPVNLAHTRLEQIKQKLGQQNEEAKDD